MIKTSLCRHRCLITLVFASSNFVAASVIRTRNLHGVNDIDNVAGSNDSVHNSFSKTGDALDGPDLDHPMEDTDIFAFFRAIELPLWVKIVFILGLLTFSGLFSGLNLGLMALDQNDLKVIASCGTKKEKQYAATIAPVRARGNFLLCTLLLGNVLVNTTLTTLLDDVTGSGAIAVLAATLSIVIFGEILPQAICSRHGLAVGANTIGITYIFMAITSPFAYPISVILDKLLGEEIGVVYNREQLMEYIRITRDYTRLEENEYEIISGALALRSKVAGDVMTPIDQVYMLPLESKLTYETVGQINARGYSRIPVYADGDPDNVVGLLHTRDLALIDPADGVELKAVLDYHKHPLIYVYTDTRLDYILQEFKNGKSHMALVRSIQTKPTKNNKWARVLGAGENLENVKPRSTSESNSTRELTDEIKVEEYGDDDDDDEEEEGDPYNKLEGIVTLEDIIEEILGSEIIDESDILAMKLRDRIRESGKQSVVPTLPEFMCNNEHCDACCKCICGKKNKNKKSLIKSRIASEGNLISSSPTRITPSPNLQDVDFHRMTGTEGMNNSQKQPPYRKYGIQRNLSTQSYVPKQRGSNSSSEPVTSHFDHRASVSSSKVSRGGSVDSESTAKDIFIESLKGRSNTKTFTTSMSHEDDAGSGGGGGGGGDDVLQVGSVPTSPSLSTFDSNSLSNKNNSSRLPPLPTTVNHNKSSQKSSPLALKPESESPLISNHRLHRVSSKDSS